MFCIANKRRTFHYIESMDAESISCLCKRTFEISKVKIYKSKPPIRMYGAPYECLGCYNNLEKFWKKIIHSKYVKKEKTNE